MKEIKMAKSLGSDAAIEQPKTETIDLRKAVNSGVDVTLSIGDQRVREMPGADFLVFLLESVEIVQNLFTGGEGLSSLTSALKDEKTVSKLHEFFAKSMGLPQEAVKNLTPSDYIKLVVAVKQAYDWETLQKGFTELGLTETLQTFLSSSSQETVESSPST